MLYRASLLLCCAMLGFAPAPKKTVAILYFDNYTGSPDYDPLGKGISSMMISDLSSVPEIQLVERDRMQDLLKEIDLQHTKYFDSTTSVKVGHMVGAEYVVVGAFAAVDPQMRIDTRVVRVATGEIVKTAQEKANRVDALSTMTAFSQALAAYDRQDYETALKRMGPVMQASPNSMFIREAFSEMRRRAAATAADKAKDKIKAGIGGFLRRPPM
jgi:TolB-like protein